MRPTTLAALLALTLANFGCNPGPTQPSGQAQVDAQNAGQKQAEDDEKQNQAEGRKMAAPKKK